MTKHTTSKLSTFAFGALLLVAAGCGSGGGGGMGGCGGGGAPEAGPTDCPSGSYQDPKTKSCKRMNSEQRQQTQGGGSNGGSGNTQSNRGNTTNVGP